MSDQLVVLTVFVLIFAGIIAEKLDKTIIVLLGAAGLMLTGYIGFEEAIHSIDFDTICLLMGMMLVVEVMSSVGVFELISVHLGILTRGNPLLIFITFSISTAVLSAFLDNVTTVLIMIPLMIRLANGLGIEPKTYIFAIIFFSNIGGAATLIGDPPNILIGSAVPELTFNSFIQYLTAPVVISMVVIMYYLRWQNPAEIRSRNDVFSWLFLSNLMLEQIQRQKDELQVDRAVTIKAGIAFALILLGFFTHAITHIEPPVVALAGAVLLLVMFHKEINLHHVIEKVEWPTLLFFSGLFIVVGTMEHVGLLEATSHLLVSLTTDLWVLLMIVLWSSAVLSAIVDNIPFVAVMIPVLKQLMKEEVFATNPKTYLLWWALALGACFGGNGSMIGASANVVSCAIAKSSGIDIGFKEFAKRSVVVTFITIVISMGYITLLYWW